MSESRVTLDMKDKKLLFELDKNSRLSLSQIARKVGVSQEVVFHRVNRLKKLGVIKRFQTIVAISRIGYVAPKVYLQLQDLTKEKYKELYTYLMKHKSVFWFGLCQGRWDLIIAYWSKDSFEFGRLVDELLNKFSKYILEREVSFGKNTIQFNRRWFYSDRTQPIEFDFGVGKENFEINKVSLEILKHLANNARMSVVELSTLVGKSVDVVRYNLKQLEKHKIISGYKFALNAQKLGYEGCKSFLYFKNINEKRLKELIAFCKSQKNIVNIVLCVGSWDMEIEFEVKDFDEFYTIMDEIKNHFKDVIKNYESVVFKEEPKQEFMIGAYPIKK